VIALHKHSRQLLIVGDVAQPAIALRIAPRHQHLTTAHAQRSGPEPDERAPLAVFFSDVAHHLADEATTEPVLTFERLVEAGALFWKDRPNRQRWRRHLRVCSRAGRVSASTTASVQVSHAHADFAEALGCLG